jgi:hypothetical protein
MTRFFLVFAFTCEAKLKVTNELENEFEDKVECEEFLKARNPF